ncbi:sodium/hydrogen exchanger 8-like isoform X2 [Lineus longissimus]|uniref:sodium/hydrogen exchanger 8-like isoform X2 n=1 Tax=Lineus longissimus TaxID=88925 RepID=UPI00315CB13D
MAYRPLHGKNSILAAVVLVTFTLLGGLGEPAKQNGQSPPPPKPAQGVKPLVVNPAVKANGPKPTTSSVISQTLDFIPHQDNDTLKSDANHTTTTTTVPTTPDKQDVDLPEKGSLEDEHHYSMTIFFILLVLAICIMVTHMLISTKFHYLPESIAIILVGALIGLILRLLSTYNLTNWQREEAFPPTIFFIVILPPIIFESGYNLHKGNFFQNIGSILVFAIFGTIISAVVIGGGVYLLGRAQVAYQLNLFESFAFGSLISAVDPVATLAIFHALDVEPVLYMLVFGESVLNDAVSIVLTTAIVDAADPAHAAMSGAALFFQATGNFLLMFFASAAIGVVFGLISAMVLKFFDLRKTPSLEFGLMFAFSYAPYGLSEGLHLSGIMAILFCGIVMSHYTHLNLSPVTQITVQQTFRTISFMAETCVFAYLGLAIFSFRHIVKPSFVLWSIALCLIGRAMNIFPLSFILNYFREHKITRRMQFIMWFSGLRGAIAFALSLHLEFESEKRHILVTSTLIIVLFTVLFLGGSTMPLMKILPKRRKLIKDDGESFAGFSNNMLLKPNKRKKTRPGKEVTLSKTKEFGDAVDSEHLSELTEEEYEINFVKPHLKGFLKIDAKFLVPFFTRRFTQQEVREGKKQMTNLTDQWYKDVRAAPSDSEDEEEPVLPPPASERQWLNR